MLGLDGEKLRAWKVPYADMPCKLRMQICHVLNTRLEDLKSERLKCDTMWSCMQIYHVITARVGEYWPLHYSYRKVAYADIPCDYQTPLTARVGECWTYSGAATEKEVQSDSTVLHSAKASVTRLRTQPIIPIFLSRRPRIQQNNRLSDAAAPRWAIIIRILDYNRKTARKHEWAKPQKELFSRQQQARFCAYRLFDQISFQRFVLLVWQLFEDGRPCLQQLIWELEHHPDSAVPQVIRHSLYMSCV